MLPYDLGRELTWTIWQQIPGNLYVISGFAALVLAARAARGATIPLPDLELLALHADERRQALKIAEPEGAAGAPFWPLWMSGSRQWRRRRFVGRSARGGGKQR